ncbi:helix-turn-helix transcriptional regulator [Salipaludibacillus agaradhaerens]|uniref:helix-turn-helix transcriptional regulator n=1 Tax=Salipaludibacillus agaradhaerens TaxID=76935 RepID=UPI000997B854|nr:YafY family protein [Salipaludibacillus agaradhaerens]
MRGDRLLTILLMLQAQGRMTANELAEKLEVSERTIYRDMDALSGAGIPVFAERGKNGGWSLLENFQTNLTGLKESEIQALFVSPSDQLLDDLGLTRPSEEARNKVISSIPAIYREKAKEVWNRIYIDTSSWRSRKEKIDTFDVLKDAIWQDHKLKIVYERADGQISERIVEPLGLVAKGVNWYFIAAKENGEIRNYRASRIHTAVTIDETFCRPKHFNIARYWEASKKAFIEELPIYDVWVKVPKSLLLTLSFTNHFVRVVEVRAQDHDSFIPVKLSFHTEEDAKRYLLGFADQLIIIEPEDLHHKIFQLAESIVVSHKLGR